MLLAAYLTTAENCDHIFFCRFAGKRRLLPPASEIKCAESKQYGRLKLFNIIRTLSHEII